MGACLYNLTTNNITATQDIVNCGCNQVTDSVRIHFSKYAYKPSHRDDDNVWKRHLGPTERAFAKSPIADIRDAGCHLYVGCKNKTELAELADLKEQYGHAGISFGCERPKTEQKAEDIWPEYLPTDRAQRRIFKNARFAVPVYRAYGTSYCDESDRTIVGFLIVPAGLRPTARTNNWKFVEVAKITVVN